ncbi:MAG: hypothetical protein WDW36_010129 [Sanguina aurantia]
MADEAILRCPTTLNTAWACPLPLAPAQPLAQCSSGGRAGGGHVCVRPPPRPPSSPFTDLTTATVIQPGTGALVLPGANSEVQFFDAKHDRHIMLLQAAPRNTVSVTDRYQDANTPWGAPEEPRVQHVAFNHDGSIMVTVDLRPDAGPHMSSEPALKFWDMSSAARDGSAPAFELNTRVDDPHRGPIGSVAYHPTLNMVVTTGACDGEFRVWTQSAGKRTPGSQTNEKLQSRWRCRSIGSYRGLPLTASAFSSDGSTLAVAAAGWITLWEPATNRLAAVLPPSLRDCDGGSSSPAAPAASIEASINQAGNAIARLTFVPGTPFLVGASAHRLIVWNLLTAAIHWSQDLDVCSLSADPLHGTFAVVLASTLGLMPTNRHYTPLQRTQQQQQQSYNQAKKERRASQPSGNATAPAQAGVGPSSSTTPGKATPASTEQHAPPSTPTPVSASTTDAASSAAAAATAIPSTAAAAAAGLTSPSAVTAPAGAATERPSIATPGPFCVVLVFDPSSPMPKYYSRLAGCSQALVLHDASVAAASQDLTPLLLVRDTRQYTHVSLNGFTADDSPPSRASTEPQPASLSAFEAVFGPQSLASADGADLKRAAQALLSSNSGGSDVDGAFVAEQRWRKLFDAPSHALPPATALAQAFLLLLTAGAQ